LEPQRGPAAAAGSRGDRPAVDASGQQDWPIGAAVLHEVPSFARPETEVAALEQRRGIRIFIVWWNLN
jgi:hypothetical protein